jgi:uncharacterized membrane protein
MAQPAEKAADPARDPTLCEPTPAGDPTLCEPVLVGPAPVEPAPVDPVLFEAVIVPHRSLSPRGLRWLIGLICALCGLTAFRFWLIGAWPVMVFSAVEVGLAVLLLLVNASRARAREMILLTDRTLRVVRTTAAGRRQERELPPTWLNVALEEAPGRAPRLVLVARGVREEVGAALGEAERRDLARALEAAVHLARNPRFDNFQLRDENTKR